MSSLDFQQARIKQVLFKSRLRSILYGVRAADASLFTIAENPLGQWLLSVAKSKYADYGETHEIERLLRHMISLGRDLANQYAEGRLEEARTGLARIDEYSDLISAQLERLEEQIRLADDSPAAAESTSDFLF